MRISIRVFQEIKGLQIFRKTNISYLLIGTRTCAYRGKKCSFFGKFEVLCFLETPVLRFTLLPYYWWIANIWWKVHISFRLFLLLYIYICKNFELIICFSSAYHLCLLVFLSDRKLLETLLIWCWKIVNRFS